MLTAFCRLICGTPVIFMEDLFWCYPPKLLFRNVVASFDRFSGWLDRRLKVARSLHWSVLLSSIWVFLLVISIFQAWLWCLDIIFRGCVCVWRGCMLRHRKDSPFRIYMWISAIIDRFASSLCSFASTSIN